MLYACGSQVDFSTESPSVKAQTMNIRIVQKVAALMACCALMALVACRQDAGDNSGSGGDSTIVSVAITPSPASVDIGATQTFHAQASAANNVAVASTLVWSSS